MLRRNGPLFQSRRAGSNCSAEGVVDTPGPSDLCFSIGLFGPPLARFDLAALESCLADPDAQSSGASSRARWPSDESICASDEDVADPRIPLDFQADSQARRDAPRPDGLGIADQDSAQSGPRSGAGDSAFPPELRACAELPFDSDEISGGADVQSPHSDAA